MLKQRRLNFETPDIASCVCNYIKTLSYHYKGWSPRLQPKIKSKVRRQAPVYHRTIRISLYWVRRGIARTEICESVVKEGGILQCALSYELQMRANEWQSVFCNPATSVGELHERGANLFENKLSIWVDLACLPNQIYRVLILHLICGCSVHKRSIVAVVCINWAQIRIKIVRCLRLSL